MDNTITTLGSVQNILYKFTGPCLMFIGTVSSLISLVVFNKLPFRRNPCSIYLTMYHVSNFANIYTSLLLAILSKGYGINPTIKYVGFCRFFMYTALVLDILPQCFLVLGSIDRILITSRNNNTRAKSTHRLAYTSTICVTIFWILFHSHALFLLNIIEFAPSYYDCYFYPMPYLTFITYYLLIVKQILFPLLLIIFGLLTLKNVRSILSNRIIPHAQANERMTENNVRFAHSKDRQLIRILLMDILTYLLFISTIIIFTMYELFTQYKTKSFDQIQIEVFLRYLFIFCAYVPSCISLYTNLFLSKVFQMQVKAMICL